MDKNKLLIVTPYLADANNGNWRTARRWKQLLTPHYRVEIVDAINATQNNTPADVIIALHARRSFAAIAAAKKNYADVPLIVVLTGTDLYRDIADSAEAQRSLALADALIVLQEDAIQHVPKPYRQKTHIVFQSASLLTPAKKARDKLNCVVVGHLRQEKSPETIFQAASLLSENSPENSKIHITHIGDALDDALAKKAAYLTATLTNYRWVGTLPHGLTRAAIKRAHLFIHPSIMEGGANVIVEAITAGTPVIASKMSGNVGMLGIDYAGYFPVGDAPALVALLQRIAAEPNLLTRLNTACKARSALFSPSEERRQLDNIICQLIGVESPFLIRCN